MSMRIDNALGMWAQTSLREADNSLTNSLAKISSGKRINRAADDASGMAIANRLGSEARGLGQGMRNANDAIAMAQIADGALAETSNLIATIREKSLQSANASQTTQSRQALQADIDKSIASIDRIAQTTTYNGQHLLAGGFVNKTFQTGAAPGQTISLSINSTEAGQLGGGEDGSLADINVLTPEGAQAGIAVADQAMAQLDTSRSEIGAVQNQLISSISNQAVTQINTESARSAIEEVDFAEEAMNLSRMQNLLQARTFAATQAGKINQTSIMKLLQG